MKYKIAIIFVVLQLLPIGFAQDYTQWELPEGAIARLGKGDITGNIVFSPDSTMIAIPSLIGIWLYDAKTYKELALLTGDTSGNDKLKFSPDGTILVSVDGWDGETIQLWNMSDRSELGKQKAFLIEHKRDVSSIAFSPDGKTLACVCYDKTVVLWNPHTGEHKMTLKGHTNHITSIAFAPDSGMLVSASYDGTVWLWDTRTGKQIRILKEDKHVVYAMAFSSDSRTLANLIYDRTKGVVTKIRLLDTSTGKQIRTLYAEEQALKVSDPVDCSVRFSPDALTIVGMGEHWTMRGENWTILWDVRTGKQLQTSKGGLAISPDWSLYASTDKDRIILSDMKTGKQVKMLAGYKTPSKPFIFSPDGKTLANDLGIWDIKTGKYTAINEKHVSIGFSSMFIENSEILANWWSGQPIRFWNTKTAKHTEPFTGDIFAVSSDGKTVAGGFRNWQKPSTIHIWDAKTHALKLTIDTNYKHGRQLLAFSPDGNTLVSSGQQQALDLWDANTGEHKLKLNTKPNNYKPVVFYPDNQILVCPESKDIQLWNVKTGAYIATLKGHTTIVDTIIFSPDGSILASTSHDETIRLWDAKTYEHIATLIGHTDQITSIAFSPDGKTLATASLDNTIRLWDTKTGKHKKVLLDHIGWVTFVAFSPDGETLVSAGGKTIRFLNTETWKQKLTLNTHLDNVSSIVFSLDGKTMMSIGRTILLWKLNDSISFK